MPETTIAEGGGSSDPAPSVRGRVVMIAGANSASGLAAARALSSAGARVVAVARHESRLRALATEVPGVSTHECDLTDEAAVRALVADVHDAVGPVDGILHLVGGWRGGGGLAGQSDGDFRFLERSLTALRHVSRAFDEDLRASDAARLAIVSSTAVARPLAAGANYAAVKAASEAWTRAVGQGFAKSARDGGVPLRAAAVIFRVKTLEGLEEKLAASVVDLWAKDAAALNDTVVTLEA